MATSEYPSQNDLIDFSNNDGHLRGIELANSEARIHKETIPDPDTVKPALPPADHGSAAWMLLGGCFVIEAFVWGLPFSYGIFQQYYSTHEPFASEPQNVAAVGTIMSGIIYFLAPFISVALRRWPHSYRPITLTGQALLLIGLISASFAQKTSHLIITQGVLYGLGGGMLYNPIIVYLDQWFIARKGLAYGVLWAGTGAGGAACPLILDWTLKKYGFRTTLRVWAISMFIMITPLIPLVKPRLPPAEKTAVRPLSFRFLRYKMFWFLECGVIIEGLGYFMPSIYLLTFGTTHLHLNDIPATLLITALNLSSVAGTIIIGYLIDRLHPSSVILLSSLGAALSVFLLWGFAISKPIIYIFAIAYGLFAGSYAATWTGFVSEIQRDVREADAGMIMNLLAAGRGLGSVSSGRIGEALLGYMVGGSNFSGAYGTEYGGLIVFTGVTAVVGGLGFLTRFRLKGVEGESVASTMEIRTSHEETR